VNLHQDIEEEKEGIPEGGGSKRFRNGRKEKMSYEHDMFNLIATKEFAE